jgi:hypothetical protein
VFFSRTISALQKIPNGDTSPFVYPGLGGPEKPEGNLFPSTCADGGRAGDSAGGTCLTNVEEEGWIWHGNIGKKLSKVI